MLLLSSGCGQAGGELGVPSSWGIAHYAASGANHGGFDEPGQGHEHGRLLGDVHEAGCAGGMSDGAWGPVRRC